VLRAWQRTAEQQAADREDVLRIMRSGSADQRAATISHPVVTWDDSRALADDPDLIVRLGLALKASDEHESVPADVVSRLVTEPEPTVRIKMPQCRELTSDQVRALASDPHDGVSAAMLACGQMVEKAPDAAPTRPLPRCYR
jgi:hypothetical protein